MQEWLPYFPWWELCLWLSLLFDKSLILKNCLAAFEKYGIPNGPLKCPKKINHLVLSTSEMGPVEDGM